MTDLARPLARVEARRTRAMAAADAGHKSRFGQFFTPPEVADLLASLFDVPEGPIRLLDPGAGVGSLTAAVAERLRSAGAGPVSVTAVEVDAGLGPALAATLADIGAADPRITGEVVGEDFIGWAIERGTGSGPVLHELYDLVVMNPPYRKIATASPERRLLSTAGIEVSNLYAAFLALAVRLLRPGGQLVAITPRSFANGPYFRQFRTDFLKQMALRRIHVFDTRDTAFAESEVLQENVVFHATKDGPRDRVVITSSAGVSDDLVVRHSVPYGQVVDPQDDDAFIHLGADEGAAEVARRMRSLTSWLGELGCQVSTGRVVDFRAKDFLLDDPTAGSAPLIYPSHCADGGLRWPLLGGRKPNALRVTGATEKLLLPSGCYVVTKRFSSKEERRRIVAFVIDPGDIPGDVVAFENHLNVYHVHNAGLDATFARGLACFLNSTVVDRYFRQFNGHTQVNATDLRKLPYPCREQLLRLGEAVGVGILSQENVDALVAEHVGQTRGEGGCSI